MSVKNPSITFQSLEDIDFHFAIFINMDFDYEKKNTNKSKIFLKQ